MQEELLRRLVDGLYNCGRVVLSDPVDLTCARSLVESGLVKKHRTGWCTVTPEGRRWVREHPAKEEA
jgi:hypothetical protein